eukprot:scaffold107934_cov40-Tisochrysis_lutea.AAC.3
MESYRIDARPSPCNPIRKRRRLPIYRAGEGEGRERVRTRASERADTGVAAARIKAATALDGSQDLEAW